MFIGVAKSANPYWYDVEIQFTLLQKSLVVSSAAPGVPAFSPDKSKLALVSFNPPTNEWIGG